MTWIKIENRHVSKITTKTPLAITMIAMLLFATSMIYLPQAYADKTTTTTTTNHSFTIKGEINIKIFKGKIGYEYSKSTQEKKETDWNKSKDNDSNAGKSGGSGGGGGGGGGDPLLFSLSDKPVNTIRAWPEWHPSRLVEFDLFATGENVTLSRVLDNGTMTLFLDLNGDGKLSDGTEWLFDQHENVYQILSRPLIDSNQNGWFDYSDDLWSIAMVKDGERYYTASELGIIAFNWSNHVKAHGDMWGENRQYSDCLYEGVYLYPDCVAVSDEHFAIVAYNQNSILLNDGRVLDSFGSVMGCLDMPKDNTSEQIP